MAEELVDKNLMPHFVRFCSPLNRVLVDYKKFINELGKDIEDRRLELGLEVMGAKR